jgi:hypothetical protein
VGEDAAVARRYPHADVKMLWGLSAGRCCFPGCNDVCIAEPTEADAPAVLGNIAHIVAHSPDGPRADPQFPLEALDSYANWALLCPTHHTLIDKQADSYPAEVIRGWKLEHERWVAGRLGLGAARLPARRRAKRRLYRLAPRNPWAIRPAIPDPRQALLERWDDPLATYAVLYAAEDPFACFAEVLARFRPSELGGLVSGQSGERSYEQAGGSVPEQWLAHQELAEAVVRGRFADLEAKAVRNYLDESIEIAVGSLEGAELSTMGDFRISQEASRAIHQARDHSGDPAWDGLIYRSRLVPGARLYVLFETAEVQPGPVWTVQRHDPVLRRAADSLGLEVPPEA